MWSSRHVSHFSSLPPCCFEQMKHPDSLNVMFEHVPSGHLSWFVPMLIFYIFTEIRRELWLNETVAIKVSMDCVMDDDDDLNGFGRYEQTCSCWVCFVWGHDHHDGMWQDSLISGHQSEMDDDDDGEMIDTNMDNGVVLPISMCVRELESR